MTAPLPAEALIDALAVARLTRLVQQDTVPPVLEVREWLLARYSDRRWADLLDCVWCCSVWVAAGVALARWRFPRAWSWMARALAGSAVAGHLSELSHRA